MQKRYFIFDFDSTVVTIETLEELAKIILENSPQKNSILAHIQAITSLGMEGKISFQESLSRRLALFSPTQESIRTLITRIRSTITPSVLRNISFFRKYAEQIYIISGGFKDYIIPIAHELGIPEDHVLANSFIFDQTGRYSGIDLTNPLSRQGGKAEAIKQLGLEGMIYIIGDGYTDYEVKLSRAADTFYAFTENISRDAVVSKADKVIKNLDDMLPEFLV